MAGHNACGKPVIGNGGCGCGWGGWHFGGKILSVVNNDWISGFDCWWRLWWLWLWAHRWSTYPSRLLFTTENRYRRAGVILRILVGSDILPTCRPHGAWRYYFLGCWGGWFSTNRSPRWGWRYDFRLSETPLIFIYLHKTCELEPMPRQARIDAPAALHLYHCQGMRGAPYIFIFSSSDSTSPSSLTILSPFCTATLIVGPAIFYRSATLPMDMPSPRKAQYSFQIMIWSALSVGDIHQIGGMKRETWTFLHPVFRQPDSDLTRFSTTLVLHHLTAFYITVSQQTIPQQNKQSFQCFLIRILMLPVCYFDDITGIAWTTSSADVCSILNWMDSIIEWRRESRCIQNFNAIDFTIGVQLCRNVWLYFNAVGLWFIWNSQMQNVFVFKISQPCLIHCRISLFSTER